jgi:hypothetical protein
MGEKIKHQNILNQNGANMVYLHGQDIGRKLGLPSSVLDNVTPFPASTTVVVQKTEDTQSDEVIEDHKEAAEEGATKTSSWPRRILSYLGVPGITAGVVLTGMGLLLPDKEEVEQPVDPPAIVETIDPNLGFTIKGFNK